MTSNRINNLQDPSSSADAATKSYVDNRFITVTTPVNTQDAANKGYVDTKTTDMATNASVAIVATAVSNLNTATGYGSATVAGALLYPAFGHSAGILTNGEWRLYVTPTGNIGIGTTNPLYPLHINKTGGNASTGNYYYSGLSTLQSASTMGRPVTLGVEGGWIACDTGVIMFSDQRIKSDIINVDIQSNLELFRKIRPVKHGYIDKLEYGNFNKYGFIAQEVQQLLPEAVVEGTQVIPSVYCNANIVNTQNNFLLRLEKPLKDIQQFKIGIKLKCYDDKNEIVWVTIKEIIDAQNIEIEENITIDKLFVYGHSVDDFLQIEKDTIWTVATAALQEVDRQQQADKARIAELENTVATQQSLINDILERLKTLEKA